MTNAPAFTAWLDDFFASYYRHRPVNATFIGVHDYDDQLPDLSAQGIETLLSEIETQLHRASTLPNEPLTAAEAIDRELATGFLEIQRWEIQSQHFQRGNPCFYTGEAIFGIISLLRRPFAPAAQRLESARMRLGRIPALLEQAQQNIRHAPLAWTEKAIDECDGALKLLQIGFPLFLQEHSVDAQAFQAALAQAEQAFVAFQHYLAIELRAHPSDGYACGPEALNLLIQRGHFLPQNADAIERYAADQFAENAAYLDAHAADFGAATRQEALAALADLHPTADGYYARYAELWDACRAATEQHELLTWPEFPIRYVPRPAWARAAAPHLYFLFYHAPAPFDRLPELEYLVTPIELDAPTDEQERLLRANNDSVIKLNHVVHHGATGHHVQNWHAARAESRIGQIAGVDCASRIAMFCSGTMTEGWACYTTELMDEFGFLTPLESYAERQSRMRMAARALVDVRLHRGKITFDQAVAFYRDEVGMPATAALGEAVKNSMFPGTALMYLTGTDAIHELRRELAARPDFELRAFHDRLLSYGSIPVALIAREMREDA